MKNKTIFFEKRPEGKPTEECFRTKEGSAPEIQKSEVLLKTRYVSVDPYLRGRMSDRKSYTSGLFEGGNYW